MAILRDHSKTHPFGSFDPLLPYYEDIKSYEIRLKFKMITDEADMQEANEIIRQHLAAGYHYLFEFSEKGVFNFTLVMTFGKPKCVSGHSCHNYPYFVQSIKGSSFSQITDAPGKRFMMIEQKNYNTRKPEEYRIFRPEDESTVLFSSYGDGSSNNNHEVVRFFRGDRASPIGYLECSVEKGSASVLCCDMKGKKIMGLVGQSMPEMIFSLADQGGLFWVCIRQYKGTMRFIMFRAGSPNWRAGDEEAIILLTGLWSLSKLSQRYILQ